MTDHQQSTFDICDRVAEAQAILHDHSECGKYTPEEVVAKLDALLKEEGLLLAVLSVFKPPCPNLNPAVS